MDAEDAAKVPRGVSALKANATRGATERRRIARKAAWTIANGKHDARDPFTRTAAAPDSNAASGDAAPAPPSNAHMYFWRRYREDTASGAAPLRLNQNSAAMRAISPGDTVWAFAPAGSGRYAVVARFAVARVGENPEGSRARRDDGRWWFEADPGGAEYFDADGQPPLGPLIQALGVKADAGVLGRSFQGGAGVRRLDAQASAAMASHAASLRPDRLAAETAQATPVKLLSSRLAVREVYTRKALGDMLGVDGNAMGAGVFRRQGTASVLLFATERKGADRTQYADRLEGDTLFWEGQEKRATDPLIVEHGTRGLELLVFHRRRKDEFSDYSFRYLGPFEYVSRETPGGDGPTSFVLRRAGAPGGTAAEAVVEPGEADTQPFDPGDVPDTRETVARQIKARRGQQAFRDKLLAAYGRRCAITGCPVLDVLEAAHNHPYRGEETNHVANGLLLRADLHTLLDCGLLAVDPDGLRVVVAPPIRASSYGKLHGRTLRPRQAGWPGPSAEALGLRFEESTERHGA